MSRDVSPAFVQQFESEVHAAYQEQGGKLRETVRVKTGVTGEATNFPVFGKGAAQDRGASSSDVKTMGVGAEKVKCPLVDKVAADFSDVFDEAKLNFDDRQELASAIAYAMGRCEDQLVLDALANSATTNVIEAATTGLTLAKVKRAKLLLDRKGIPNSERFLVCTPDGISSLLDAVEVTSTDYNNVKALVNGEVDTFLGFKFVMISDEAVTVEGGAVIKTGLTGIGTTDRTYYAYHKKAVGEAIGMDKETHADWVPTKTSFLIQSLFSGGAVAIDKNGIVAIQVVEAA